MVIYLRVTKYAPRTGYLIIKNTQSFNNSDF